MRLWDLLFRRDAAERPAEVRALSGAGDGRQLAPAAPVACPFANGQMSAKEAPVGGMVVIDDGEEREHEVEPHDKKHLIFVEGCKKPFHHVRTKPDGTWVYAPVVR